MGAIGAIWNNLLYIPLLNVLVGLYHLLPLRNLGVAILIFTALTRLVLYPLTRKSREYQKAMQKLQPEIEKLRKKYPKDKEKLYQETMKLYSKHKANPAMGCLPLLIQFPFTIALYQVLREGLAADRLDKINSLLYAIVPHIQQFNTSFLWFDLAKPDPYYILPILVAAVQYVQAKLSMAAMSGQTAKTAQQTMIYMPLILLFITLRLPSGLAYYILLTTVFGVLEQQGLQGIKNLLSPSAQPETSEQKEVKK